MQIRALTPFCTIECIGYGNMGEQREILVCMYYQYLIRICTFQFNMKLLSTRVILVLIKKR